MINEDIRHVVEAELLEGETLLWADETSQEEIDTYVGLVSKDTKFTTLIFFLAVLCLVALFYVSGKYKPILMGGLFYSLLFLFGSGGNNWQVRRLKNFKIGAYALTNLRIFELSKDLKITDMFDARNVKSVFEGAGGIILRPVRRGWFSNYKIRFLKSDVYLTINKLDAQIKAVRS